MSPEVQQLLIGVAAGVVIAVFIVVGVVFIGSAHSE